LSHSFLHRPLERKRGENLPQELSIFYPEERRGRGATKWTHSESPLLGPRSIKEEGGKETCCVIANPSHYRQHLGRGRNEDVRFFRPLSRRASSFYKGEEGGRKERPYMYLFYTYFAQGGGGGEGVKGGVEHASFLCTSRRSCRGEKGRGKGHKRRAGSAFLSDDANRPCTRKRGGRERRTQPPEVEANSRANERKKKKKKKSRLFAEEKRGENHRSLIVACLSRCRRSV